MTTPAKTLPSATRCALRFSSPSGDAEQHAADATAVIVAAARRRRQLGWPSRSDFYGWGLVYADRLHCRMPAESFLSFSPSVPQAFARS